MRAPRGRMQGGATRATVTGGSGDQKVLRRSSSIGEERRRRRRPHAALGCGGRVATGSREILMSLGSPALVLALSAATLLPLPARGGARGVSPRLTSAPAATAGRVSRSERPAGRGEGTREANACGRKLDTTPASIFQQPAGAFHRARPARRAARGPAAPGNCWRDSGRGSRPGPRMRRVCERTRRG